MVTSQMRPILTLVEDRGPGVHDTLVAACSHELYEKVLGIGPEVHKPCATTWHSSVIMSLASSAICIALLLTPVNHKWLLMAPGLMAWRTDVQVLCTAPP